MWANDFGLFEPVLEKLDARIPTWIMKKVGCKPSYWESLNTSWPLCSTLEQMTNARNLLFSAVFGTLDEANYTGILPCRSLEKIQYDVRDIDLPPGENQSFVMLIFNFRDFTYKEVKDVRSMDIQALIGISALITILILSTWHIDSYKVEFVRKAFPQRSDLLQVMLADTLDYF